MAVKNLVNKFVQKLYFADFKTRLKLARSLSENYKKQLYGEDLQVAFKKLLTSADDVAQLMAEVGASSICSDCGEPEGGCCSHQMGEEADGFVLLSNLLLGESLKLTEDSPCWFMGPFGCQLKIKPFFCLEYFCLRIQKEIPAKELQGLTLKIGELQQLQVELEQKIMAKLEPITQ